MPWHLLCLIGMLWFPLTAQSFTVTETDSIITIATTDYQMRIGKASFQYAFYHPDSRLWLGADTQAGLVYLNAPVNYVSLRGYNPDRVSITVCNTLGVEAQVLIEPFPQSVKINVVLEAGTGPGTLEARTGGLAPAYGLGDHAAGSAGHDTEVSGFSSRHFGALSDGQPSRLVSNFVVFPRQGVACVNMEPTPKRVTVSAQSLVQGVAAGTQIRALYYFFGTPVQLYQAYLAARDREGYTFYKPKYEWFGIGWEAWGALAWNTRSETVKENIDHYLTLGFPLDWMVVGSGFWPKEDATLQSTTSFGRWDTSLYPDPVGFIKYFHDKGLKVILGLRIAFVPHGPYTQEGLDRGFFIKQEGQARLFTLSFPKPDCYLLDAHNPEAVAWYVQLCQQWLAAGIDGFKEDLFGYEPGLLPDDKLDAVNRALMDKGVYVMGRNGYLGSAMDLHRFEDFNYNQNQDRGPVNSLAFAYSGFPYVYPDIVCGKGLHDRSFGDLADATLKTYFVRNAWFAALHPSMSFGYGVWHLQDDAVTRQVLAIAHLHHQLHPYFYSAAVRSAIGGFPYTLTPLPLAYPEDAHVHGRENPRVRGYVWLVNETLLACPLYGDDYATATTRDLYLPAGIWIDYDNGQRYEGPTLLKEFAMPLSKTPLFVGGTGLVVLLEAGKLMARVYDTGFEGTTTFYNRDGQVSTFTIAPHSGHARVRQVKDLTTGKKVKGTWANFAYAFNLVPGHDYRIE